MSEQLPVALTSGKPGPEEDGMTANTTRNTEVIATVPLPNGGTRTITMTVEHLGYWVGVQVTYRDTGDRTVRDFSSQGWPDDSIVEPARRRAIEILTPDTVQAVFSVQWPDGYLAELDEAAVAVRPENEQRPEVDVAEALAEYLTSIKAPATVYGYTFNGETRLVQWDNSGFTAERQHAIAA